jgi:crotonobetainyl-CoA:carnitine CoA-transferase CaiB-like acyl-CoA transferase
MEPQRDRVRSGPLVGMRVIELADDAVVSATGRVLADWGAQVDSIGRVDDSCRNSRADRQHFDRGKRGMRLDLTRDAGRAVFERMLCVADVILVNPATFPDAAEVLDVTRTRVTNPGLVYGRGTPLGVLGPRAMQARTDSDVFWIESGNCESMTPEGSREAVLMPSPGYGLAVAALALAGGVAAALFSRNVDGKGSVVDVSLLSAGAWAAAIRLNLALTIGATFGVSSYRPSGSQSGNPLYGPYKTADGRWITLTMLQPGRHWPDLCALMGREDLITDRRFASVDSLLLHGGEAGDVLAVEFRSRSFAEWFELLEKAEGTWAPVRTVDEVAGDVDLRASEYVIEIPNGAGNSEIVVNSPVQFDGVAPALGQIPDPRLDTPLILKELGYTEYEVSDLRARDLVS